MFERTKETSVADREKRAAIYGSGQEGEGATKPSEQLTDEHLSRYGAVANEEILQIYSQVTPVYIRLSISYTKEDRQERRIGSMRN